MEDLNNYIKELSKRDKKSLSQKGLKLTEEVGELAKVILPYDSADGTNHRFVDKEALLDAIADVHLTNISIGYSLGFTDEEINEYIARKAEKWNSLQLGEEEAKFPLPYEIHITIDASKIEGRANEIEKFELDNFINLCKAISVKPIVLDLPINGGTMKDVMTSSKHFGNNRTAYEECKRISNALSQYGYIVVREKIETVPWHPASPKAYPSDKMPEDCYFEAHIGCIITPNEKEILERISKLTSTHLSKNFFKKMENGKYVNMMTYRKYDGDQISFECDVKDIKKILDEYNIEYEKVITEFSIYDTKVSHDFKWINE